MTDRSKFEEMLERLVNEDRAGAEELFHEIVVEKSREIYQNILEAEDQEDDEDLDEAEEDEDDDTLDEEADEENDDELDEMFGLDELAPGDGSDAAMGMGGDAADDMMGDVAADDEEDFGDDDGDMGDNDVEGRMDSLEDKLAELSAEFEKLMAGEEDEPEHAGMFGDEEDEDEEDDTENDDEVKSKEAFAFEAKKAEDKKKADAKKSAGEQMREYVEKVSPAKMGDNGANAKSIVAGKNDMGGTTANILRTDTEAGVEANKGQLKGNGVFKGTPKDMNTKNVNVPGAKNATKLSAVAKGHGAEKKGAGETADKSAGSMINGAPRRAK
jgi:hypothetical protein